MRILTFADPNLNILMGILKFRDPILNILMRTLRFANPNLNVLMGVFKFTNPNLNNIMKITICSHFGWTAWYTYKNVDLSITLRLVAASYCAMSIRFDTSFLTERKPPLLAETPSRPQS